jgi:hypothetical protein
MASGVTDVALDVALLDTAQLEANPLPRRSMPRPRAHNAV